MTNNEQSAVRPLYNMMKRYLAIVFLVTICFTAFSQEPWQVGFGVSASRLADNGHLQGTPHYPFGVEAEVSRPIVSDQYWVRYWKNPRYGFRLSYKGMPDSLAGDMLGLNAFMQGPFGIAMPSGNTLNWVLGLGLSYYTNPYQRTPNDYNKFIGSYVNCLIEGALQYEVDLGSRSALMISGKFVHTSNGYLMKPNRGLNYWQLGLGYRFASDRPSLRISDIDSVSGFADMHPRHKVYLSYGSGIVKPRHSQLPDRYYYGYTAMAGYLYRIHPCFAVGGDLDFSMNTSNSEYIRITHNPYSLPCYIGLYATGEAYWGPIALRLSLGYEPFRAHNVGVNEFTERVGLFCHFGKRVPQWAGLSMKLYYARVDFLEWTYAISLFNW